MKKIALVCVMALFSSVVFADAPSNSGIVSRTDRENAFLWWYADDATGLGLAVGSDVVSICGDGPVAPVILRFSDKDIQDGLRLVAFRRVQDASGSVWPFTEFDCDRFLKELPLAAGEVDRSVHDNDFFGNRYCDLKDNISAFSHSIHGTLYSPFGEKRQLSAHQGGLFDCDTKTLVVRTKIVLTD